MHANNFQYEVRGHIVKLTDEYVLEHITTPHHGFHGSIIQLQGMASNNKVVDVFIAVDTTGDCDKWFTALHNAHSYLSDFYLCADKLYLIDVALRMKSGVSLRERVYRLSIHYRCFVGSEGVAWIMNDQQCSSDEAVAIGNRLVGLKIIYHVTYEHLFCNAFFFYRFDSKVLNTLMATMEQSRKVDEAADDHEPANSQLGISDRNTGPVSPVRSTMNSESDDTFPGVALDVETLAYNIETVRCGVSNTLSDLQQLSGRHALLQRDVRELRQELDSNRRILEFMSTVIIAGMGFVIVKCIWSWNWVLWDVCWFCLIVALEVRYRIVCAVVGSSISRRGSLDHVEVAKFTTDAYCLATSNQPSNWSAQEARDGADVSSTLSVDLPVHVETQEGGKGGVVCAATDGEKDGKGTGVSPEPYEGIPRNITEWPNYPLLARRSPDMLPRSNGNKEPLHDQQDDVRKKLLRPVRLHKPGPLKLSEIALESDLFSGRMILLLNGLDDSSVDFFRYISGMLLLLLDCTLSSVNDLK